MTRRFKKVSVYLLIALSVLSVESCRKKYFATAEDMAEYGWDLYTSKDYINSNKWFNDAIENDTEWKDAYNGLGWSYAQLAGATAQHVLLDSGINNFITGLTKPKDEWNATDVQAEILAGLTFAYHAKGNDSKVLQYGSVFLDSTAKPLTPGWIFSHDSDSLLNYLDVRIILASSYFAKGKFDSTIIQVKVIVDSTKYPNPAITDTSLLGRKKMAEQIKDIQEYLRTK